MRFIGFDREDEAIEWAKSVIGVKVAGLCRALSCVDASGRFAMVVVLSNFSPLNIDVHVASPTGRKWATPKGFIEIFNAVFHYIFDQLGAVRATALIKSTNIRARQFVEHLQFKLEGVMRKSFETDDLCIYGLLDSEFYAHPWRRV